MQKEARQKVASKVSCYCVTMDYAGENLDLSKTSRNFFLFKFFKFFSHTLNLNHSLPFPFLPVPFPPTHIPSSPDLLLHFSKTNKQKNAQASQEYQPNTS